MSQGQGTHCTRLQAGRPQRPPRHAHCAGGGVREVRVLLHMCPSARGTPQPPAALSPGTTRGAQPWDRCPLTVAHLPAPLTGQSCLARYQWEEG